VRGLGLDDPPLPGRRALPNRPPAAKPHPRSAWALANPNPRPARSRPAATPGPHTRPGTEERALKWAYVRPTSLVMTGFENLNMPWSLNGPVAEPPRTWPPSEPTRSRPWSAPRAHGKHITLPRRLTPTAPLSSQRHHPTPPPAGQPPSRHVADGAEAQAGQARTQSGGEGGDHRAGAEQATATKAALAKTVKPLLTACPAVSPATDRGWVWSTHRTRRPPAFNRWGDSLPHGSSPSLTRHRYPD
jgi:hypothetical protein